MPSRYNGSGTPPLPARVDKPRDECAIPQFDTGEYVAQIKKNGTHSLPVVHPDRNVVAWNRHGAQQTGWQFNRDTAAIFRALPGSGWYIYDGELIHRQVKGQTLKNQHYIYDILVCDGILLTGTTYEFRYQLLFETLASGRSFPPPDAATHAFRLDDYTSIARNYSTGFKPLFDSLTTRENEGLVLRRRNGVYRGPNANDWMVKFRRKELTKNY